jgi:hypothetical protein
MSEVTLTRVTHAAVLLIQGSGRESRGMCVLERRWEALESGPGGDHDLPYRFGLPLSLQQVLAWVRLLTRVQHGELQP